MFKRIAVFMLLAAVLCAAKDPKYNEAGPLQLTREGEKWAEKTLKKLTLEEKIGQLLQIMVFAEFVNFDGPEYAQFRDRMQKYHLGSLLLSVRVDGPLLLRNQPYEAAMLVNQFQRDSKYPLLIAADFERGPSMRLQGVTQFPAAMAFGAAGKPENVAEFSRIVAQESRALGVHWNYFPVADVNSNPANPIINTRSYGEDPALVGNMLTAYIKAARAHGMMTTAKHFPGHGDTDTDSHLALARVGGDLTRLKTIELPPFQKAIDAGVDSVMIAHVTVPALDPNPNTVATLSPNVVTNLLKKEMGFKGLVVTDAMEMRALTRLFADDQRKAGAAKAAVQAMLAGNDMVLLPSDLDGAFNGLVEAAKSGELPMAVVDAAVLKVLRAKASLGLHKSRFVDLEQVGRKVGRPENSKFAQGVADSAVTLVKDNGKVLPLKKAGTRPDGLPYTEVERTANRLVAVVFSDDMRSEAGRRFERELRSRVPDARIISVDARTAGPMAPRVMEAVQQASSVVVAAYVVPTAGRGAAGTGGTVGLAGGSVELLNQIFTTASEKTVMIAMGNPYLGVGFSGLQNYMCTFSNSLPSEIAAVKALFGEIPVQGRLPVTLPQLAERGTGLDRPAQVSQK